ncbi:alpha/beta-hydrolase [Aulographum hederae CBS 113979]|uniref:Alpha/beta-hydrolase n=1 Tax=Aulographum hederae CBS 113979 TaxID=1176131 RepID=A0A6G1H6P4_9PEZI|nr:alpha/beta-hydrolase [Aulographum hederae CBS 113979]
MTAVLETCVASGFEMKGEKKEPPQIPPKPRALSFKSEIQSFQVGDAASVASRYQHHGNVKALWEGEWRMQCQRNAYPFNQGADVSDFDPIFASLAEKGINDPFDEAWPVEFLPHIRDLIYQAHELLNNSDNGSPASTMSSYVVLSPASTGSDSMESTFSKPKSPPSSISSVSIMSGFPCDQRRKAFTSTSGIAAGSLYLRAAALCHIARYPVLHTPLRRHIWSLQKKAHLSAASFGVDPVASVEIPHHHASIAAGDGLTIPILYRYPASKVKIIHSSEVEKVPVVIQVTGLDGHRGDTPPPHTAFFQNQGWATISLDIPGCGDCPAAPSDPESPDRLFSSLLDWITAQPELDASKVMAWGYSTGAYYSLRLAHTHHARLLASVVQGAYVHHAFSPAWMRIVPGGEYHADLPRALSFKFGIGSDYANSASPAHPPFGYTQSSCPTSLDELQKSFSLLTTGVLEKGHGECKILVVNGKMDTIYPIEDSELVMGFPGPKELRVLDGPVPSSRKHMGEPAASPVTLEFLTKVVAGEGGV